MRTVRYWRNFAAVLSCIFGVGAPALAGDSSGIEKLFYEHYEVRLGGFAHGIGGNEQGSADVNAELIFPKLWGSPNSSWSWLVPRPHIGAMINTAGLTSYGYLGGLWTYNVTDKIFAEAFVGGAVHDGELEGDDTHAALGCRVLFHVGGSAGYRFAPHWSVMATFDHISNGNAVLNACPHNAGLNEYGLRLGFSF